MFHVGQMVVCIKTLDRPGAHGKYTAPITRGQVLTIRSVDDSPNALIPLGLRFEEVINAPRKWSTGFKEAAYDATRFRPVRPHSIQIFHDIANGVKQPEKENV